MFHPYRKDSSYLRTAIFNSYKKKCVYCGCVMQQRNMHVDHIIPTHINKIYDEDVLRYLSELDASGFVVDAIENYLPSCPACNIAKNNHVFTAANLRYYHEVAKVHVNEILQIVARLESEEKEYFFEPLNEEVWETVDFSYQRGIAYAIMGYRLTPADVKTCPRSPQVEKIKLQLAIVDYVIVQGEPGCGKSISLYQVAHDFYQQNWKVYRYIGTDSSRIPSISNNTEPSIYILDDAQCFPDNMIESISAQARPNAKILFSKTLTSSSRLDSILLTNIDAVKILHRDFLLRKNEVMPIVHKYDRRVGINPGDLPLEWRLNEASKALTPWQFNYVLRGGWQTMKEQYQNICNHRNYDLLTAAIALFQIVQLDSSIDYHWLCDYFYSQNQSLTWNNDDLQYLTNRKIVLSVDDVRIIHIESAAVIIAQFWDTTLPIKKQSLCIALENMVLGKKCKPLGLVWLLNMVHRHTIFCCEKALISEKIIDSILENLDEIKSSENRAGISFFMEKIFDIDYPKNGFWYFKKHWNLLLDWIAHASSENAYAYSRLINSLHNEDKMQHRIFAKSMDWSQISYSMQKESTPNLYAWGDLLNRLTCSLSKQEYPLVKEALYPAISKIISTVTVKNIAAFSDFLSSTAHLLSTSTYEIVQQLLPIYGNYFKTNLIEAIQIFDFEFFLNICGLSLLGQYHASKEQKATASAIVETIPDTEFAEVISNSTPRDWQRIHEIIYLIWKYNKAKARKIVTLVNLSKLSENAKSAWNDKSDIEHICIGLYIGSKKVSRQFISDNQERIQIVPPYVTAISPLTAITLFERGISVELLSWHKWDIGLSALSGIIEKNEVSAKLILHSNIDSIIERLIEVSSCDFENGDCLKFLKLIYEFDPDSYKKILSSLDIKQITKNWERMSGHSKKDKQAQKYFDQLVLLVQQNEAH